MILIGDIIDAEPSSYEEVDKKKGKETMIKEYHLIIGNDVCDVVLRPNGNFVVSSIGICKI